MFVIIKYVKTNNNRISGKKLPVILLNVETEVWEFDTIEEAEKMKGIFQINSDSGHVYEVKKI
jgi:hypothetical protein